MNYKYKIGYIKDYTASILFLTVSILLYFIKDLNRLKKPIILILILGFIIDFSFTINPSYHFTIMGYNTPTYIVFGGFLLFLIIVIIFRKNIKFTF